MDTETKIKKFIKYAKEVCLQNLFLADNIKVDLKLKSLKKLKEIYFKKLTKF